VDADSSCAYHPQIDHIVSDEVPEYRYPDFEGDGERDVVEYAEARGHVGNLALGEGAGACRLRNLVFFEAARLIISKKVKPQCRKITYTAASTKECISINELTNQWSGGVKGLRELKSKGVIPQEQQSRLPNNSLSRGYSPQTLRQLLPYTFPFQIDPRDTTLLHTRLIFSPIQREGDIEQLPREHNELIESEWIVRDCGSGRGGQAG
jgi:hypothetical protein